MEAYSIPDYIISQNIERKIKEINSIYDSLRIPMKHTIQVNNGRCSLILIGSDNKVIDYFNDKTYSEVERLLESEKITLSALEWIIKR